MIDERKQLYRAVYLPIFVSDVYDACNYIAKVLHNEEASKQLYIELRKSIANRLNEIPGAYEVFCAGALQQKYRRIYVKKYIAYYTMEADALNF